MAARQRTTVYLQPKLYRALKVKAAITDQGISELINEAVALALREDAIDRKALRKGRRQPSRPLTEFLSELKRDGLL